MQLLAEATASGPTLYLIILFGSGGALAALLPLFKLRGDRDSQAVSQAVGAMETMETLQAALVRDLERANARADFYRARCNSLEEQFRELNQRWGPFPVDEDV